MIMNGISRKYLNGEQTIEFSKASLLQTLKEALKSTFGEVSLIEVLTVYLLNRNKVTIKSFQISFLGIDVLQIKKNLNSKHEALIKIPLESYEKLRISLTLLTNITIGEKEVSTVCQVNKASSSLQSFLSPERPFDRKIK